jgi:hypothetical protein
MSETFHKTMDSIQREERRDLLAQISRARELPQDFLDCRSLGHAWSQHATDEKPPAGCAILAYHCLRCGSIRTDTVSGKYGELLARNYKLPPNYRVETPGDGRRTFSAAAFRAERLRRATQAPPPPLPE